MVYEGSLIGFSFLFGGSTHRIWHRRRAHAGKRMGRCRIDELATTAAGVELSRSARMEMRPRLTVSVSRGKCTYVHAPNPFRPNFNVEHDTAKSIIGKKRFKSR
jgi:hypothetical protein